MDASPTPPQSPGRAPRTLAAVVPGVRAVARILLRLALASAVGGAVLWWLLAHRVLAGDGREAGLFMWAVALLTAPAVLAAVGMALRALAGMPDRAVALPARAQERAAVLAQLAQQVRRERRRGWFRSGMTMVRLWRAAAGSRELLDLAGPAAFLFSPLTWLAAALGAVVAVAQVAAGVIAVFILLAA
jgi:hypothetical protein